MRPEPLVSGVGSPPYAVPDEAVVVSVIARIVQDEGVSIATAERWFSELLKFLDTDGEMRRAGNRRPLVPSPAVDAAWHAFILHTQSYADFCERHLGGFAHHRVAPPGASEVDVEPLFQYLLTRVLIAKRHGELDEELWPLTWGDRPASGEYPGEHQADAPSATGDRNDKATQAA
jgi:hypothetical protein